MKKGSSASSTFVVAVMAPVLLAAGAVARADDARGNALDEVIVTAQKREQSLQDAPLAIAVMGREQLAQQGISGLDALQQGAIPALRIHADSIASSTLNVAIRGNAPSDLTPITREPTVGIYLDGIYLARAQGLSMEVPDLDRIEVLRGPQGTLFGRNSIGGAVSLISKKPSGRLGIEQTVGAGNYDARRSVTRVDLPEYANVRAKFDYVHAQRDGWVKNTMPGESDFDRYSRDGGRFSVNYAPVESLTFDYAYDQSRVSATEAYFQLWNDGLGAVGNERNRETRARAPIPLHPTYTYQAGHALTASWDVSDCLTVKSLTGYRSLRDKINASFGAALYFNGFINDIDDRENQFSQELQFIGTGARVDWVGGLYYFRGYGHEITRTLFALDTAAGNTPITPPTDIDLSSGLPVPPRRVTARTQSKAAYGQATYTPALWGDRLHLTAGLRYTLDKKDGARESDAYTPYDLKTHHWDSALTADYAWLDNFDTYIKRSTGYRSGSVNARSTSFASYAPEKITTWEVGVKSEFWDRRLRLNADTFRSDYTNLQFDFTDPANVTVLETINAKKAVAVDGVELDLTAAPAPGLLIGLSYSFLEGHMPLQPNPLAAGVFQRFYLTLAPRHAGALSAEYRFAPQPFGTLVAHVDATSTSGYHSVEDTARTDAYALLNARLTFEDIPAGQGGTLRVSVWGKNLTDAEYAALAFKVNDPPLVEAQAFGEPRTYGIDFTYRYR